MLEIPPWKAELLERKKAAKKKAEQIPEWKRELLKRLQNKAESAKQKMDEDEKQKGAQTVLNEHIMKVSDNIFVRQERHRKMSANSNISTKSTTPSTPSPTKEFAPSGFHIIKKENIVIIEKDAQVEGNATDETKEVDKEMPESGIVNRLKDKFVESKPEKPGYQRVQSSDSVFDTVRQDTKPKEAENPPSVSPPLSPYHRTYSAPTKPSSTQHAPKLSDTGKPKSLDFYTPRSFTPRHEVRSVSSPTKKVTAPVLQPKNKSQQTADQKNVDISSLHSSGSPKRQGAPKSATKNKQAQAPVANVGYSVDLHSGSRQQSSDLPVSDIDLVQISDTETGTEAIKPLRISAKVEDTTVGSPAKVKEYTPVAKIPSSDKENIPHDDDIPVAPPRLKTSSRSTNNKSQAQTRSIDVEISKVDVNQNPNEFKIVNLGRVSFDPSQLKSKGAIAANEIMKESKTILVIPKGKSRNDNVSVKPAVQSQNTNQEIGLTNTKVNPSKSDPVREPVKKIVESEVAVDSIKPETTISQPVATKQVEKQKSLPVSSVDDVIIKEVAAPKNNIVRNSVLNGSGPKPNSAKADVPKVPAAEVKLKTAEVQPKNNFTVNRSSANSVQGMLGPRRGGPRAKVGGGNSFVFDPSKFKKSAAPPISSQTTKRSDTSGFPKTMVIQPNPPSANSGATVEDGKVQPKGKRKLTVDQIQVIGGYVKLDHCCLSKKRQKSVSHHVAFKQERLESVYEYPSERSLLLENHELSLKQQSSLNKLPGSGKDSQLGKYTPKYLLSMKENLKVEEDDDSAEKSALPTSNESADATPLDDAATFSSTASADILF